MKRNLIPLSYKCSEQIEETALLMNTNDLQLLTSVILRYWNSLRFLKFEGLQK